jgi:GT2 family glycosyltransferase
MSLDSIKFSIIIPTFNRPERLAGCLRALSRLDYPRECFEVIVVDDGSAESPVNLIETQPGHLLVRLIVQTHGGPAQARNTGAAQAQGHYLAFTDDDCAPHADWLTAFARCLDREPDRAVGGRIINALSDNPYSTVSQDMVTYFYSYYNRDPDQARFFTSNNIAVPRELFNAMGGFDSYFKFAAGEDRDFCDRWLASGRRLTYAAEAVVSHFHRLDLLSFWRQHLNYGRGGYYFHKFKAKRQNTGRQFETWQFYFNLVAQPFRATSAHRLPKVGLGVLTLLSQIANVSGYYLEAAQAARSKSND